MSVLNGGMTEEKIIVSTSLIDVPSMARNVNVVENSERGST